MLCDSGIYGQYFIFCLSFFLSFVAQTSDTRSDCLSGVNPCLPVRCHVGEECDINKFGIARCECPPQCEPVMRPVCGQDGRTYESLCEMRRASCVQKKLIEVKHTGSCGKTTTVEMWPTTPPDIINSLFCTISMTRLTGTAYVNVWTSRGSTQERDSELFRMSLLDEPLYPSHLQHNTLNFGHNAF